MRRGGGTLGGFSPEGRENTTRGLLDHPLSRPSSDLPDRVYPYINMSIEDVGLLAALQEAHRSDASKTVIVRFSPDDTRRTSTSIMGMPFGGSSIDKAWVITVNPALHKKIRVFKSMMDMLPPNTRENVQSKIDLGGRDSVLDNLAKFGTDPLVPIEQIIEKSRLEGKDGKVRATYFETLLSLGEHFSGGEYSFTEEDLQAIKSMEELKNRLDREYGETHPVTEISTDPQVLQEHIRQLINGEGRTVNSVEGDYYKYSRLPEAA